jgi:hypothetical protein
MSAETPVYFITGQEREAAELFVEENSDMIEKIDFSSRNTLESSINQEVYDWIRHAAGWYNLKKFDSVVLEERKDSLTWIINREKYDNKKSRRYGIAGQGSCKVNGSVEEVYEDLAPTITESDLESHCDVEGDVRFLLELYRVSSEFKCVAKSIDGEMAIIAADMDENTV